MTTKNRIFEKEKKEVVRTYSVQQILKISSNKINFDNKMKSITIFGIDSIFLKKFIKDYKSISYDIMVRQGDSLVLVDKMTKWQNRHQFIINLSTIRDL